MLLSHASLKKRFDSSTLWTRHRRDLAALVSKKTKLAAMRTFSMEFNAREANLQKAVADGS